MKSKIYSALNVAVGVIFVHNYTRVNVNPEKHFGRMKFLVLFSFFTALGRTLLLVDYQSPIVSSA